MLIIALVMRILFQSADGIDIFAVIKCDVEGLKGIERAFQYSRSAVLVIRYERRVPPLPHIFVVFSPKWKVKDSGRHL